MHIQPQALEIVKKLVRHGYIAYFAGGWVRDYIMQRPSDDIDIATNAPPQAILDLFPKTILVGLQFGVVIVTMDGHQFEVSTFRKDISYTNGRTPEKIELSDAREDALRRDFTINGMFFDPLENKIHDYVGGMEDIERGMIRTIGNPYERFFEDRLRMIRAFRFAARFGFTIDQETQEAIRENASLLFPAVAMERIWQEFGKMHAYPHFDRALVEMHRLDLLSVIFPELKDRHLKELEKQVAPIRHYPPNTPTAFFLTELFFEGDAEQMETIGRYLKIPNKEIELVAYYMKQKPFSFKSRYEQALFYAHPQSPLFLKIYAAHLSEEDQKQFCETHQKLQQDLAWHIDRLKQKKPVLSASYLQGLGVAPGRHMGACLKQAERLAVEKDLRKPEQIIPLINIPCAS
jgi:poly(A) polymerase